MDPNRDHRRQLRAELGRARAASDEVFARLAPGAFHERPVAERHRLIFYVGHLEAFDANTLRGLLDLPSFEPARDDLFARGIDPVAGSELPTDEPGDWPALYEVRAYGQRCRDHIDAALAADGAWDRPYLRDGAVVAAIIEHRLMHVETLAYLLHQLPLSCLVPSRATTAMDRSTSPRSSVGAPPRRAVAIPAGNATLGSDHGFVWCNERSAHDVAVPAFAVDQFPVTHGDFLAFVLAGGYHEPALWREDDWAWRQAAGLHHPHFWRRHDGGWWLRTLAAEVPLPLDHPVHVSHAEASAYARWRGGRLPTEAEWHRAAYGEPDHPGTPRAYPWGDAAPAPHLGNFDLVRDDTTPVTAHPAGASAWGVHDLLGNGWEWTSTPFAPFAAFEAYPFYRGYSADFFDGKHYVLKGGSGRTAARLLRRSFRNWFQPHYPFVYATFRLVEE